MAFLSRLFKGKPSSETEDVAPSNGAPTKQATPVAVPTPAAAAAPLAVRTVMPKASAQPVNLRDPGARPPVSLTSTIPPQVTTNRIPAVRPAGRKITFPMPASPRPMAASPQPQVLRKVVSPVPVVPAPAPVLEAPDATVTLEIGDFIDRLPPNFLNSGPVDRHQKIDFQASELYSDLTKGRASVPASTIYAKVPAIFARPVTDTEDTEVSLPLQKLVEQLSAAFQTRADQVAEENVGEIETPFLQVAKEDGERLSTADGTASGAVRPAAPAAPSIPPPTLEESDADFPVRPTHRTGQISTISVPKVPLDPPSTPVVSAPATGPINPGKRPPSTVRASVAGGKIRLSGPSAVTRIAPVAVQITPASAAATPPSPAGAPVAPSTASQRIQLPAQGAGPAASPSLAVSKKTARIQIPPISLRAGGQSGMPARPGSVPPPPTAVPVQPSPVSIRPPTGTDLPVTFRSSPPPPNAKTPPPSFAPTLRPNFQPPAFPAIPTAATSAPVTPVPAAPALADDRRIELGLASVLRGVPSEALAVEPWTIADDVRVSLPFAPIEKQLSYGRVSVSMAAFVQALPETHRDVFAPENGLTDIQLPLPEIFQNLPASALAIRPDQVTEETGTLYPTPFSQKADEDAQRFGKPTATVLEAEVAPAPEPVVSTPPVEPSAPPVAEVVVPTPFTDQLLDQTEAETLAPLVRDLPLDLESAAPVMPVADAPTVAEDLPAEPVVEPPAAVEPAPVEEALAVLESTAPVALHAQAPEPEEPVAQAAHIGSKPVTAAEATAVKGRDSKLQTLFMTEDEIDAKVVVRLVCQLPGVTGCAVMFADGLRLAGNFPDTDPEGFSAMTPPFYKRTQSFVSELKLGGLKALSIHTDKDLLSFFMHDDICVSVRHSGRGFLPGVREKLELATRELAGMYSTLKPVAPVDPSI